MNYMIFHEIKYRFRHSPSCLVRMGRPQPRWKRGSFPWGLTGLRVLVRLLGESPTNFAQSLPLEAFSRRNSAFLQVYVQEGCRRVNEVLQLTVRTAEAVK